MSDDGGDRRRPRSHRPKSAGGFLATIERIGDKVPHPAMIFLALCAIVIVLSHILYLFDVSATQEIAEPVPVAAEVHYPAGSVVHELVPVDGTEESQYDDDYEIQTETIPIKSLLTGDGIRFLFTSPVANFNGFGVVGVILVAMAGVGVAEQSGLIAALIRKLVKLAPAWSITYIIVFIGLLSSVASDAGYLVLIPLGAAAYHSLGRHPLAGIAAAYARGQRRVRRQHPDHPVRRRARRGHDGGGAPRRPRRQRRASPTTSTSASARRSS